MNVLGLRARMSSAKSRPAGRRQPVTFSAYFLASSSRLIAEITELVARRFRVLAALDDALRRRFVAEYTAPAVEMRALALLRDQLLDRWTFGELLQLPRLIVEPLERIELFALAELRFAHRRFEHTDRLVINLQRHRKRMAVLAAMRQRKTRWVGEAAGRAVHHLGDHRERAHRARADAGRQQELGEILRPAIRRGRKIAAQAAQVHVLRAHIMMRRHHQMRQQRLRGRPGLLDAGELLRDAVWP